MRCKAAPTVSSPADGQTITDSTPDVVITTQPGMSVHLLVDHNDDEGYKTAGSDGTATFTLAAPLGDGDHELVVFARSTCGSSRSVLVATVEVCVLIVTPSLGLRLIRLAVAQPGQTDSAGHSGSPAIRLIGMPKVDRLVDGSIDRREYPPHSYRPLTQPLTVARCLSQSL